MSGGDGRTQVDEASVQFGQPAHNTVQPRKQALPLFGVFAVLRDRYGSDLHLRRDRRVTSLTEQLGDRPPPIVPGICSRPVGPITG